MRNPKPSLHARRNPPTRYEKINIDILNTKNKCMRIHRYVFPIRMKSVLLFIFEGFQSNI